MTNDNPIGPDNKALAYLVPSQAYPALAAVVGEDETASVDIGIDEKTGEPATISFTTNTAIVTAHLDEGTFPNYEQIWPKDATPTAKALPDKVLTALKPLAVVFDLHDPQITRWQFNGDLTVNGKANDREVTVKVPAKCLREHLDAKHNPADVAFDLGRISRLIGCADELVTFETSDSTSGPICLRDEHGWSALLMPMHLNPR